MHLGFPILTNRRDQDKKTVKNLSSVCQLKHAPDSPGQLGRRWTTDSVSLGEWDRGVRKFSDAPNIPDPGTPWKWLQQHCLKQLAVLITKTWSCLIIIMFTRVKAAKFGDHAHSSMLKLLMFSKEGKILVERPLVPSHDDNNRNK